jgi:hypothetical protein
LLFVNVFLFFLQLLTGEKFGGGMKIPHIFQEEKSCPAEEKSCPAEEKVCPAEEKA